MAVMTDNAEKRSSLYSSFLTAIFEVDKLLLLNWLFFSKR